MKIAIHVFQWGYNIGTLPGGHLEVVYNLCVYYTYLRVSLVCSWIGEHLKIVLIMSIDWFFGVEYKKIVDVVALQYKINMPSLCGALLDCCWWGCRGGGKHQLWLYGSAIKAYGLFKRINKHVACLQILHYHWLQTLFDATILIKATSNMHPFFFLSTQTTT